VPETSNGKGTSRTLKPKVKAAAPGPPKKKARIEEIEDEDSPRNISARNSSFSSESTSCSQTPHLKKVHCRNLLYIISLLSFIQNTSRNTKRSPIYLFYEIVTNGSNGTPGDDGDVHYRCLHGAHKICTIKRSMRSNLNGMGFPNMCCFDYY
jgi:hypothetical protein